MEVSKNLEVLNTGEILKVIATDPEFFFDIRVWTKSTENTLMNVEKEHGQIIAYIKKGAPESHVGNYGVLPTGENIIGFSGELDKNIASFIIANGSVTMGRKVTMFFTFWGRNILRKSNHVRVKKTFLERMFGRIMPRGA